MIITTKYRPPVLQHSIAILFSQNFPGNYLRVELGVATATTYPKPKTQNTLISFKMKFNSLFKG